MSESRSELRDRADSLRQQGEYNAALSILRSLLDGGEDEKFTLGLIGALCGDLGDHHSAISYY